MQRRKIYAIIYAVMAAVFYAINVPLSKLLVDHVGTTTMAALLCIFSGAGSLIIAMILHEKLLDLIYIAEALLLGFVAYGLSIFLYMLGAGIIPMSISIHLHILMMDIPIHILLRIPIRIIITLMVKNMVTTIQKKSWKRDMR